MLKLCVDDDAMTIDSIKLEIWLREILANLALKLNSKDIILNPNLMAIVHAHMARLDELLNVLYKANTTGVGND